MVVPSIILALVALIATLSVTEMVRLFAHRLSAVDRPGGRRIHRRPTARLGGLGIYWGFYVAMALATYGHPLWSDALHGDDTGMIGMMVGSSMLLLVGVADDIYGLKAVLKLGFQVVAALLLYGFGWHVETAGIPGLGAIPTGVLSLPLTVLWVVAVTNAVNLIDGLDGLACGVALIATLGICVLLGPHGGPLLLASAALAGALLGFLWFNLNPALIFMGDAGSLFVGFVLSAMTLRAGQLVSTTSFPLVPALLIAVPLFDTCFAIGRRSIAAARGSTSALGLLRDVGSRVFSPDGMHVHHRLVRAGYSVRRAVALLWVAALTFAVGACLLARDPLLGGLLLISVCGLSWRGFRILSTRVAESLPTPRPLPIAVVALVHGGTETTHAQAPPPEGADTRRAA